MASGGTSWQYYNNSSKYKMPPPNSQAAFGAAGGDVQDMHLKMSKKIAQLTKVIYALNTKNDEHESALLALKEAHEEESQQLMAETAAKLQHYRQKIGNEFDLRRKVQNLEEVVCAAEKEKRQAMIEFESFKRLVEEREMRLESDHSLKVMSLTKDLMECKAEFEQRLRDFHDLKTSMRNEGGVELEKLANEHRKELERLHAVIEDKEKAFKEEKKEMIQSNEKQVQACETEIVNLKTEFKKLEEDFESKMNKSKSFYERELAAIRSKATVTDEDSLKRWQEREAELRDEASKLEYSLKKKLAAATEELRIQSVDVGDLKRKLEDTVSQIKTLEGSNSDLSACLSKAEREYTTSSEQLQYARDELEIMHARLRNQESDILKKSSLIGSLEAGKVMQEATIQDLQNEIKILKSELSNLSSERESMQNDTSEQEKQLKEQMQALGKRLEVIIEEKSNLKEQLTKALEDTKQSHAAETQQLTEQYENEKKSLERDHQVTIDRMKAEADNAMEGMLREMQDRLRKETTELLEEKNSAVSKIESEKQQLETKLRSTQNELTRYEDLVRQHESGLGDATSHINGLKSKINELQKELEMSEGRLRTSEASKVEMRKEMESNNMSYENRISSLNRDHSIEMEKMKLELDSDWQEKLRSEIKDLHQRLMNQHSQDKRTALEEIQSHKEREFEAAKLGWQEQIGQLTSLISELKNALEQQQKDYDRSLAEERTSFAQTEKELRQVASDAANEYSVKIAHMENAHRTELTSLEYKKEQDIRTLESNLISQHREDQQNQMQANRLAIDAMKDKMNQERQLDVMRKEQEGIQKLEQLRSELLSQHASEMDYMQRDNEQKQMGIRLELEKAMEIARKQEADLSRKITILEEEISQKMKLMKSVERKSAQQGDEIISLNREIDRKGQEILRIRSEANNELRRHEEELSRRFQREQDKLEAESLRQKQILASEFTRVIDSLKDKISSLNIALREAEDRYERRESRPEDLNAIRELKSLVQEKESLVQKLVDDKKYYELELVNRETNFNKVFSASPNVGVLNPLNSHKKKNDRIPHSGRFASQFVNVPNMSTIESALTPPNRLGPLKTGPMSPSTSSTASFTKNLQPTPPPPRPKKFIRLKAEELPLEYQTAPANGHVENSLKDDDSIFLPATLSKYMPDDFEGSLKEFDRECEIIESRSTLSSSCQSLNSLEGYRSSLHKVNLTRSATLPLHASPPQGINHRPTSCVEFEEEDFFPDIDDIIDDVWSKRGARSKRFRSNYSASLPNHYLQTTRDHSAR